MSRPSREAPSVWANRVRAHREQVERAREGSPPLDSYAPNAARFAPDPGRDDDPALVALLSLTRPDDRWLDVGAGAGRYALPLALQVRHVHALDPSPAMLTELRAGMRRHGIENVSISQASWPLESVVQADADAVLMAHVGYTIEDIDAFVDALERAASRRCVAILRTAPRANAAMLYWQQIHGEAPSAAPALPEFLALLEARGSAPEVTVVDGKLPWSDSLDDLLATSRRHLYLQAGSVAAQRLESLVRADAIERDGRWTLDDADATVGVVTWQPRRD